LICLSFVAGGFINVDESGVTVVTDSAEWSDEIDIDRAKEAKERAESRLQEESKENDVLRAKVSLNRAVNRIRVVDQHMNHDNL
jgi:F-type H+-transporting ATPase subunit epsilon